MQVVLEDENPTTAMEGIFDFIRDVAFEEIKNITLEGLEEIDDEYLDTDATSQLDGQGKYISRTVAARKTH